MNKKYENSGNLFPAANTEVVRKGTVDIDGTEAEMVITRTRTKDGKVFTRRGLRLVVCS